MIHKAVFKSFKALADVAFQPGQLAVLVGRNGSGKTSVLDGLYALCQLGAPHAQEATFACHRVGAVFRRERDPRRLVSGGQSGSMMLRVEASGERTLELVAHVSTDGDDVGFEVTFSASDTAPRALNLTPSGKDMDAYFRDLSKLQLGRVLLLRLDAAELAKSSYVSSALPRVGYSGYGLPSVLSYLAGNDRAALDAILADLRSIVPEALQIRMPPAEIRVDEWESFRLDNEVIRRRVERPVFGNALEVEIRGSGWVPADLLSEGTLLTLGLLTVLHAPTCPSLVLLDDIDRALHPRAQLELVARLRDVLARKLHVQLVCTSHSPYLLDALEASEVHVMKLDTQGRAACKPLVLHPDWSDWKGTMTPGEFWSEVGEDWLFRSSPSSVVGQVQPHGITSQKLSANS